MGFCPTPIHTNYSLKVADYSEKDSVIIGDLLSFYAHKPNDLVFIQAEVGEQQTLAKATYQVTGMEAGKRVEVFLIQNYNMGPLKFYCCGWESGGQLGQYTSKQLKAIDPYCSIIITMHSEETIVQDRNKIKKFYVIVEVVVV